MYQTELSTRILLRINSRGWTGRVILPCLLAACAASAGCGSLQAYNAAYPYEPVDGQVTLTIMQRLDSGTLLQSRGSGPGLPGASGSFVGYAGAIAARGGDIFVIDRASGELLRIDAALQEMTRLIRLADPSTHGLYAARNGTVFVVDKAARAVRQLDRDGRPVQVFEDRDLAPSPVDVTESDWGNAVIVADELARQLAVFNPLGAATDVVGSTDLRLSIARALHAIAASEDSVFVLDSGANEVMRFDLRGRQTGSYGEDELELPTALAVDDCGRLYVADSSGAGIFVSSFDMRVPPVRAQQNSPIEPEVTDLWIDGRFLYVAAGSAGIRVYLVEPACGTG